MAAAFLLSVALLLTTPKQGVPKQGRVGEEGGLLVDLMHGKTDAALGYSLTELGLGDGGLLPPRRWRKQLQIDRKSLVTTRGGAKIHLSQEMLEIELPSGARIGIDERARLVGEQGPLTLPALLGLSLRLADGTTIRAVPGKRGLRKLSIVEGEREILLVRNGRRKIIVSQAKAFHGIRLYLLGKGDVVMSLVSFGAMLYCRPVAFRGRNIGDRLIVFGDLLRDGARALERATPRQSRRFPMAQRQADQLASLLERLLEPGQIEHSYFRPLQALGITMSLGPDLRLRLSERGRGLAKILVLSLHLSPSAEASLEYLGRASSCTVKRVLPPALQQRSRFLGTGVSLSAGKKSLLPWKLPFAHPSQRKRALAKLGVYLRREDKKAKDASGKSPK